MYTIKAYHGTELVAAKRVYSLDRAIRVSRYIKTKIVAEAGFKSVLKLYGFKVVITKE